MDVVFDPAKDTANQSKHGISLARANELQIEAVIVDDRANYRETRYRAFGMLDDRPYCLVFTVRDDVLRAISLRRVHLKEYRRYAQADES